MRCSVTTWVTVLAVTWQGKVRAAGEALEEPNAANRLELRPYAGWAAAPNSVVGAFVGAKSTFRVRRRWAVGADGAWYSPFEPAALASDGRYPLNRTSWSASLDAAFFPWVTPAGQGIGPGSGEAYLFVGAGLVATRPIAVVDPSRQFEDNRLVQLNAGVGARLYSARGLGLTLELRDLVYFDKIENSQIATGEPGLPVDAPNNPANPATWYSPYTRLTNCLELRLGASLFVF